MRECRGRHNFCWRLLSRMEISIKYRISYWYRRPGNVNSLGYKGALIWMNISIKNHTMRSQRGHSGESNPTWSSEGNRKYVSQNRPEGTNGKNIMRERCASHARRGVWERPDFSEIPGLLAGGPRCLQIAHYLKITNVRAHDKNIIRDSNGGRRTGQAYGWQNSPIKLNKTIAKIGVFWKWHF